MGKEAEMVGTHYPIGISVVIAFASLWQSSPGCTSLSNCLPAVLDT